MPVRRSRDMTDAPLIWRYFVQPKAWRMEEEGAGREGLYRPPCAGREPQHRGVRISSPAARTWACSRAWAIRRTSAAIFVWTNTLADCWTAHGRYPTNTPGWWGGAHPFTLLDISVVHNGEISSYDANRRCMEMYGYDCKLLTDTEVIAYMLDYLVRRQGLTCG